ncbi:Iron-sulfur clusters transporter atm1, mitochondrial [Neolecta irregularis DAH-3]|uniref:Iron-sulfur clusters transporter ATM1, mitochondrial n=1 Tax=Neolecta irregularis (strain DAH-3) TaxID=1198029 RepID=A0A1U7LGS3_NEOID|nr:Iron-sulfur clusters transporter atm1, mitochondrial [Neolecta irregularis DAH-3]|eukprot:OLL21856.1 Iron-sulfur clusters transporter atm1, mitochondrial [Neolecta irregularis DAH-3]
MAKYLWPKVTKRSPNFDLKGDYGVKGRVVLALGLLVGGKLLNVRVPFYFKDIVDSLNIEFLSSTGTVWTVAGAAIVGYGLARIGSTAFQELRNAVFASVAQGAIRRVARNIFDHLLHLDLNFHLSRETGGLSRAIDRGTKGISFVLTSMVLHIMPTALEIAMVCGILVNPNLLIIVTLKTYNFGAQFAGVTVATMVAYAIFTVRTTSWRTKFRRQANAAENRAATIAVDSLLNFEAVKHFNNEQFQINKYDAFLKEYESASLKVASSLTYLNIGQNFIFSASLTAMMYFAAQGIIAGGLTVGELVMINQLVFQLSLPLNFLGSVYRELRQSLVDMNTLFSLQRLNASIKESPNAKPLQLRGGEIKFEDVRFWYHPDKVVLDNVSFTILAGQKVAVVGPSGCGKSTILKLLYRFYDIQGGRILIDGQDIRHVTLDSLRRNIGIIPQDTTLFNDTVLYNIRYGNLQASDEQVFVAARASQIHDAIMSFPEGYNTKVGERGSMLSGGEKQRLAVARVILKDAPILTCDEATSALDTKTERRILASMKTILHNSRQTSLFIAHRLRTIFDSDLIIVMDRGQIVESGTHQQLSNGDTLYASMLQSQEQNPLP